MRNLIGIAVFISFMVLFTGINPAQAAGVNKINKEFTRIDANRDRSVSPKEMQVYQDKEFKALDKNKNGTLEQGEVMAITSPALYKVTDDPNKDGKITKEEYNSQFSEYFKQIDKNKDNKLSEAEYSDYWKTSYKF